MAQDQGVNVETHTGKVHAPHPTRKVRNVSVPWCMSRSQIMNLHYTIPTDKPVDCVKCQNYMAK